MEIQLNSLHFYIYFLHFQITFICQKIQLKKKVNFFLETRRNNIPRDPRHECEIHYLPSESESVASLHPSCWRSSRNHYFTSGCYRNCLR